MRDSPNQRIMSNKHFAVKLTPEERQHLQAITTKGKAAARTIKRAQALLKVDQGPQGPAWSDERISQSFDISVQSLRKWRKQAVLQGPFSLLERKPRSKPSRDIGFDGEAEAHLIALACSAAPEGRRCWTLQLLAERLVQLNIVESVSRETVRQVLKKMSCSLGVNRCGAFHRSKTPPLFARWSKCLKSISVLTTPVSQSCAWMRCPNN